MCVGGLPALKENVSSLPLIASNLKESSMGKKHMPGGIYSTQGEGRAFF